MVVDGTIEIPGGSATASMYSNYLPSYNERIAAKAFYNLGVDVVQDSTDYFTATITVEEVFKAFASGWKLRTALTESNIPETWGNQTTVDYACRDMYPDANGTTLDFSSQNNQTVTIHFSTAGYVKDNCEFVVFVQHDASKEVAQAAKVDMASILGIEEIEGKHISIYPNPSTEYFILNSNGNGHVEMIDLTGKIVYSSKVNDATQLFDVRGFDKGVYMVKYTNENTVFTKKVIIQ